MKRSEVSKGLGPVVKAQMKKHDVPGIAVGILHGEEEHLFGFGTTNIEFGLPVDPDTLFQIGSTTKTFTGTVIMHLVDAGKIDLDDKVTKYLPKFKVPDVKVGSKVTIRHLMTHTAGWRGDVFPQTGRGDDAIKKAVLDLAKSAEQLTPLGKVWSYNNAGFYILGQIIEKITKKTYEEVVEEVIFKPLGMTNSFWWPEDIIGRKHALGHGHGKDGLQIARRWGLMRAANPAGGIASTVGDQLKFARLHLGDGTAPDGTSVLSPAAVKEMQQPQAEAGSIASHVGLTWLLDDLGGSRVVKHGGSVNGHMSAFFMLPDHGFAITILTNGDKGHATEPAIINWAAEAFCGVKAKQPKFLKVKPADLADYAVSFSVGQMATLRFTPKAGGLTGAIEVPDEIKEKHPEYLTMLPPPFQAGFVAEDRIVTKGESGGQRGEFIRGAKGDVEWFRWGGRIMRKVG
ncbi:MAG TPA: serine hydrolase domain-containing protein [Acidimicrobiales bacterium]|nr:serine hydrolase domain-containing protein [Acidimicrobiales bacterium]